MSGKAEPLSVRGLENARALIEKGFDLSNEAARRLLASLDVVLFGTQARGAVEGEVLPRYLEVYLRAEFARLAAMPGGEHTWESNAGRLLLAIDALRAELVAATRRAEVANAHLEHERARFSLYKKIRLASIVSGPFIEQGIEEATKRETVALERLRSLGVTADGGGR